MAAPSIQNATEDEESKKIFIERLVCVQILPIAGTVSSLAFSTNVMNPGLFRSLFGINDQLVANCLWFNAHLGCGAYIYTRDHMQAVRKPFRVMYSVFGAVLTNFGTLLFWATTKNLLPRAKFLRTVFGLLSGVAIFCIGHHYMQFVDGQCKKAIAN